MLTRFCSFQANWETERNSLQQQILKEESVRIRTELLRGFAEEMSEMSDGENNIRVQDDSDKDVYSELKESIAYVKSVYEKKFNLQKVKYEDQVRKLEEWWQKEQIRVLDEQIKVSYRAPLHQYSDQTINVLR